MRTSCIPNLTDLAYGESLTQTQANMFKTSPRLASAETIFFFLACESGSFEQEVDHMKICGGVSGRREIKRGSPLVA